MAGSATKLTSPTDWPESWRELQIIDNLLRCSICSEFFTDATIIPVCCHTYCSLCIRRYLTVVPKCPSCPLLVKDTQLENNRIIDEIVKSFLKLRDKLLKVINDNLVNGTKKEQVNKSSTNENYNRTSSSFNSVANKCSTQTPKTSQKRQRRVRRRCTSDELSTNEMSSPVYRKKLKRSSNDDDTTDESDGDDIFIIEQPTSQQSSAASASGSQTVGKVKKEDLVKCPVCGQKIAESKINPHLDTCLTSKDRKENLRSSSSQSSCSSIQNTDKVPSTVGANALIPQVAKRKPLNKLVYTLLSDKKLKEMMKKHGLSIKGDRRTLVKRHQEFALLYNNECNKAHPKPEAEIVRLVEEGEKNRNKQDHGRQKLNFEHGQSQEDMDKIKDQYVSQNQGEFTRLINEIKSRKKKTENIESEKTDVDARSPQKGRSKKRLTPSKKKNVLFGKDIDPDEETASSSSADFQPARQRFNTPQRKLKSVRCIVPQRVTCSPGKKFKDDSSSSTSIQTKANILDKGSVPDPPSPSLLNNLGGSESNQSSSDSETLLPAFGPCNPTLNEIQSTICNDDQCESEEFEF